VFDIAAVPPGYLRVTIVADHPNGKNGVHLGQDETGCPYALVSDSGDWNLTISHEVLEMLVDPSLSAFATGTRPDGAVVQYLKEICDPCQATPYVIDGVTVSDFVTPAYFDATALQDGTTYSRCGTVSAPLTVAVGGYLVWKDASGTYFADTNDGVDFRTIPIGPFTGGAAMPIRAWVDANLRPQQTVPSGNARRRLTALARKHRTAAKRHSLRWLAEMRGSFPGLGLREDACEPPVEKIARPRGTNGSRSIMARR
jgi:hypothetical protein